MSTGSYLPPDWADAIKNWHDEVAAVSSDIINNFQSVPPLNILISIRYVHLYYYVYVIRLNPKTMIGHYTQLVWADTYLIGCGISSYEDLDVFSVLKKTVIHLTTKSFF